MDQLIKNAYIFHVGGIDVLFTRSESNRYVEDFAMLVHKLRGMFEVDSMFALGLMTERIYLVARSTVPQINAALKWPRISAAGAILRLPPHP